MENAQMKRVNLKGMLVGLTRLLQTFQLQQNLSILSHQRPSGRESFPLLSLHLFVF
jgi:hypothetical protein